MRWPRRSRKSSRPVVSSGGLSPRSRSNPRRSFIRSIAAGRGRHAVREGDEHSVRAGAIRSTSVQTRPRKRLLTGSPLDQQRRLAARAGDVAGLQASAVAGEAVLTLEDGLRSGPGLSQGDQPDPGIALCLFLWCFSSESLLERELRLADGKREAIDSLPITPRVSGNVAVPRPVD